MSRMSRRLHLDHLDILDVLDVLCLLPKQLSLIAHRPVPRTQIGVAVPHVRQRSVDRRHLGRRVLRAMTRERFLTGNEIPILEWHADRQ